MKAYEVVSEEYQSGGGMYDPPEYGRDYMVVCARSARRAKVIAVRTWRRREKYPFGHVCREPSHAFSYDPGISPFAGLRATPMDMGGAS